MGQFETETDAVLAQLNFEELHTIPGGEFAEIIGDLVILVGTGGLSAIAGRTSNLMLKIRKLAGASYSSNLIYTITAVRNDLKTLYDEREEFRVQIENLPNDPKFAEAISALALRAMHTSVKNRLKRLARIVVNGVKDADLESEDLDDMMRAAVELTERDILILNDMYEVALKPPYNNRPVDEGNLFQFWQGYWQHVFPAKYPNWKQDSIATSFARLASQGFIFAAQNTSMGASPVTANYWISDEGKKFHQRLQEISTAYLLNAECP